METNKFTSSAEFRISQKEWLGENHVIWAENHPTNYSDAIDFIYKRIRVRCKFDDGNVGYTLYTDVFDNKCSVAVTSHMFFNREELDKKVKQFKKYIRVIKLVKRWI